MDPIRLAFASHVPRPSTEVWRHATHMEGVNRELAPLLAMTYPADCGDLRAVMRARLGDRSPEGPIELFTSTLLVGRLLPFDRVRLTVVEFDDARFVERSPMRALALWQHERVVRPVDGGCTLVDRVAFVPRVTALATVTRNVVLTLFRHRHARLARLLGARRIDLATVAR